MVATRFTMATTKHPVLLVVLDGWGYSENLDYNAIAAASKPHWDRMWAECPHTLLRCSGLDVGLPDAQMGNSEVGHMHLGAGRLIYQDLTRITHAIETGEFANNAVLKPAFTALAASGRALHVLGLVSPGGVHSHEQHIVALLDLAQACGVQRVYVHAFLDGRDTPPKSAAASLELIANRCAALPRGQIASVVGRYFAMDRNKNWSRTALAYELIVDGSAPHIAATAKDALTAAYARGETDEFVQATAIHAANEAPVRVEDGDLVVFANFRADRARQLTTAFTSAEFTQFMRRRRPALAAFIGMTDYGAQYDIPVAFPTVDLRHTFGEVVAARGLRQLRIAETEKYAHVTFFFNGGEEHQFPGEDRILVPSPTVATYDLQPEMSAKEVTDKLVTAVASGTYDVIICNYANADMVGHTGDFAATVRCIETLDHCLGRLRAACSEQGMDLLITSDHGNAEQMRSFSNAAPAGEAHTAHTSNLVPMIYCGRPAQLADGGCLSDIAPTMLALMGLPQPPEMTGRPLVRVAGGDRAQHAA
jgi:2,3-bisphosphoglycerate-independent phosphoglycerate mutase